MITIDMTGEGSGGGALCSPPHTHSPLFTSTPAKFPDTGDFLPIVGMKRPRQLPSPIYSPSPVKPVENQDQKEEEHVIMGFVMWSQYPQIMPHLRLIGDGPLTAVHQEHRQAHDLRMIDPHLIHLFHLIGRPILKSENVVFYHHTLGLPAMDRHRQAKELMGEHRYFQLMMSAHYRDCLIQEILYAVKWSI